MNSQVKWKYHWIVWRCNKMTRLVGSHCTGSWGMSLTGNYTGNLVMSLRGKYTGDPAMNCTGSPLISHSGNYTGTTVVSLTGNYTATSVMRPVSSKSYLWSQTPFPWVSVSFHDNSFNLSDYTMITSCHHSSCHECNTCKETVTNSLIISDLFSIINHKYQWNLIEQLNDITCF